MLKFLKWSLISLVVLVVGSIALISLVGVGAAAVAIFGDQEFGEQISVKTEHAVGLVALEGEILSSKKFRQQIQKMLDHDKIKAIVVRIDSPGGAVGASEEIFRAIKRADKKKPVVCSLGNLAASGGLYSAVGCRKIITNRGTITGSIGVIMMSPNVAQVMDRLGVSMTVIKSGQFKDSGSPFRAQTEEDKSLLQSLVDASYDQFLTAVAENRSLDKETVRKFADGRVILGEQAVEWGLADSFGGPEEAAVVALELSGDTSKEDPEIVSIPAAEGLKAIFSQMSLQYETLSTIWTRPTLLYRLPW